MDGVFDKNAVMEIIKRKAPGAVVRSEKRGEVKISLNLMDIEGLAEMFANLEQKSTALGIKNIGVSVATIEEVYVRQVNRHLYDAL